MKELNFPFDSRSILRNKRELKKVLLSDGTKRIKKNIAVLGGSTVDHIISMLRLFLLNSGIEPHFYKSEYNKYYEDAVFGSSELDAFSPDIIFIHTTSRNLTLMPESPAVTAEEAEKLLDEQFEHFRQVWKSLSSKFGCPIIQNNFELPLFRRTGNFDGWSVCGQAAFIQRMNIFVSDWARSHKGFFVNDINYLSSVCGLTKWHNADDWYLYKYAMNTEVIPDLAYSIACIMKSIYGIASRISASVSARKFGSFVSAKVRMPWAFAVLRTERMNSVTTRQRTALIFTESCRPGKIADGEGV